MEMWLLFTPPLGQGIPYLKKKKKKKKKKAQKKKIKKQKSQLATKGGGLNSNDLSHHRAHEPPRGRGLDPLPDMQQPHGDW